MSVTIINGGTQGLGEAVARKLVERGATGLVLAGRSRPTAARRLAGELTGLGTPTLFVQTDIADRRRRKRSSRPATRSSARCTVSSTSLPRRRGRRCSPDTPEHFDTQMTVNVKSPYFLIQAAGADR